MFIALNGQRLLIDNPAGPEKYAYNIYNSLAKVDSNNKYVIYFSAQPQEEYFQNLTNNNPNFSYKVIYSGLSWTQHGLSEQLFKDKPDIFFTPVHTLPIVRPTKTKYITMVHGLEFTHIRTKNIIQKMLIGKPDRYACKFSDALIVPSEGTKNAIVKKNWRGPNEIFVVNEGVGIFFSKRSLGEINLAKEKYKIHNSSYLLFIGTIHPRKNIPNTIKAFSEAISNSSFKDIKFVISGKLGWDYEESLNASKKYGVEDNVLYLGRVPDEDLPTLISGAKALINFSLEEGFGLPLLEAMACETQCVVSDIPPFKEVCAEYATYCNPKKISDMTSAIVSSLENENLDLVKNAKERCKKFSWGESAKKTLNVFQSVTKNL